jgi:hypothetical protein
MIKLSLCICWWLVFLYHVEVSEFWNPLRGFNFCCIQICTLHLSHAVIDLKVLHGRKYLNDLNNCQAHDGISSTVLMALYVEKWAIYYHPFLHKGVKNANDSRHVLPSVYPPPPLLPLSPILLNAPPLILITYSLQYFLKCVRLRLCQLLRLNSVADKWLKEYGALVECCWQGKTKLPGEKPVPVLCHFVSHKSHTEWHEN